MKKFTAFEDEIYSEEKKEGFWELFAGFIIVSGLVVVILLLASIFQ